MNNDNTNNGDLQNLVNQITTEGMKNLQATPTTQKPQLNMAAIAELVQPSTPLAMDERVLVQLSAPSNSNHKNGNKNNNG